MNHINRLEESWSPKWDLGFQVEFGFDSEVEERAKGSVEERTFPRNRVAEKGRCCSEPALVAEILSVFENLGTLEG